MLESISPTCTDSSANIHPPNRVSLDGESAELTPLQKYLRSAELAERWSTTTGALATLRYRGVGPAFVRIPHLGVRYRLDVIEAYERGEQ